MRRKIEDVKKIREIPAGEKFVCMFSGGKDCGLALSKAISKECTPVALIHCLSEPHHMSLFHKQGRSVAQAQADAIGVSLRCIEYKWWVNWKETLKMFEEYKAQGVKFVLYGDLSLDEIVENHAYLCNLAGLIPCVPLFHVDYSSIIDEMEKRKIVSVITAVDPSVLDRSWLGREYNREIYNCFDKMGIDPFGENGEFHTTLVSGDFFTSKFEYSSDLVDEQYLQIHTV